MAWCWCGSKRVPDRRVDLDHLVALERCVSRRSVACTPSSICSLRGVGDRDRRLQAVAHRQQALGERLDRELARLGDFFLGAAAGVLGLGLGAQVGVGDLGVLGLQFGQARVGPRLGRRRRWQARPAGGVGAIGSSVGSWRCLRVVRVSWSLLDKSAHARRLGMPGPLSRGLVGSVPNRLGCIRRRWRSSAATRPGRGDRAWSAGPAVSAAAGSAPAGAAAAPARARPGSRRVSAYIVRATVALPRCSGQQQHGQLLPIAGLLHGRAGRPTCNSRTAWPTGR